MRRLGAAALAGGATPPLRALLKSNPAPRLQQHSRVAFLREPGFPHIDPVELIGQSLDSALAEYDATGLTVSELARLDPAIFDVFLNPYGSAFPKDAWPHILPYLEAGGNFVNLGGVPFAVPIRWGRGGWHAEVRQTAYHKTLGITQAFPIHHIETGRLQAASNGLRSPGALSDITVESAYALYYRLTRAPETPSEDGSDGLREAELTPLIYIDGPEDQPAAAPIVRVDRLLGPFAGGRWQLASFSGSISATALAALIDDAAVGSKLLTVRPSLACYRNGEQPTFEIVLRTPAATVPSSTSCRIEVFDDDEQLIAATLLSLHGGEHGAAGSVSLESPLDGLVPGLYRVTATVPSDSEGTAKLEATTGFWVFDRELLAGAPRFTTDKHTLLRGGKPYIVAGTSYMATDVHRRFLFEPNPHVWDRDFAAMKRAGVNMIRTGIWTGWKRYMPEVGSFNEGVLRALDAFILTARRHDIPVIFSFFAFIPEAWGGQNAYLDPLAVDAQKTFVSIIARRYRDVGDVIWDLINEPSFCSPERLWLTRPNYDEHEIRAWRGWLRERYDADSDEQLALILAEHWRTLPDEALDLPRLEEFGDRNIFDSNRPLKVMDYRLFANEMFAVWARELATTLRAAGSPRQLVTVGQDEGGTYERPAPAFHASSVDFTSNHTWWMNDDLLWDSVVTKTPDVPNLISETGVMFYERIDGSAWRSEEEARDLLERKLVLALASDTAGFIEWIWNTNPFMPSDNEAAIGLLRADGSAKPEFHVFRTVARFAASHLNDLGTRESEPVLMVVPHSHMFSVRNFATEATRRCVRAMHYSCNVTMASASEYALAGLASQHKLIIVPSARVLDEAAWRRLLELANAGATLLVTGAIDFDAHWRPTQRLRRLGIDAGLAPVVQEELLEVDGVTHRLSFRGDKIQRLQKAVTGEGRVAEIVRRSLGRGALIWCPTPIELAEQDGPTVALYRYALSIAGLKPVFSVATPHSGEPASAGVLIYPAIYRHAVHYAVISELGGPTQVRFTHRETNTPVELTLPAQRAAMFVVRRRDGRISGRYTGGVS